MKPFTHTLAHRGDLNHLIFPHHYIKMARVNVGIIAEHIPTKRLHLFFLYVSVNMWKSQSLLCVYLKSATLPHPLALRATRGLSSTLSRKSPSYGANICPIGGAGQTPGPWAESAAIHLFFRGTPELKKAFGCLGIKAHAALQRTLTAVLPNAGRFSDPLNDDRWTPVFSHQRSFLFSL